MGMYHGAVAGIKYNNEQNRLKELDTRQAERDRLYAEQHNQNMAISNLTQDRLRYEQKQRPIQEQREQARFDQNAAIGSAQLKNQELTRQTYEDKLKWGKEDRKRAEEEYNGANWSQLQNEGMIDFVHDAVRGGKDKRVIIDSFNKQGTPIIDYRVNPDGSITTVLASGLENEKTINPYQVGATLRRRDKLRSRQRNEAIEDAMYGLKNKKFEIDGEKAITNERLALEKQRNFLISKINDKIYDKTPEKNNEIKSAVAEIDKRLKELPTIKRSSTGETIAMGLPSPEELIERRRQRESVSESVSGLPIQQQSPVSQEAKKAIEWINQNPNDPRAKIARQKLREQGVIGM